MIVESQAVKIWSQPTILLMFLIHMGLIWLSLFVKEGFIINIFSLLLIVFFHYQSLFWL